MTLTAAYDLACNPPTYDVVAFLANLELERLARGEPDIDLRILPGPVGGFRRDGLWPRDVATRVHLRDDLVVPVCQMLPSVRSVTVQIDRVVPPDTAGVGERWISLPYILRALRAGCRPLRVVWPPHPRVERAPDLVVFTLREADHHKARNSTTAEWLAACATLRRRMWQVRVVRDTARARARVPHDYPLASYSLVQRAFLYNRAALNVGICNGPMWLSIFMDAPTLMLRPTTNAAGGCYDDQFYAKYGLPPGNQLPTSPPHQRLVWEEDRCESIVRAVEEMLEVAPCPAG